MLYLQRRRSMPWGSEWEEEDRVISQLLLDLEAEDHMAHITIEGYLSKMVSTYKVHLPLESEYHTGFCLLWRASQPIRYFLGSHSY